jgi:hypothetical protein
MKMEDEDEKRWRYKEDKDEDEEQMKMRIRGSGKEDGEEGEDQYEVEDDVEDEGQYEDGDEDTEEGGGEEMQTSNQNRSCSRKKRLWARKTQALVLLVDGWRWFANCRWWYALVDGPSRFFSRFSCGGMLTGWRWRWRLVCDEDGDEDEGCWRIRSLIRRQRWLQKVLQSMGVWVEGLAEGTAI